MRMRESRSTLKDVAKAAKVHVSTASRALNPNTQHHISPEVVKHVRETARKLDYRINAIASNLRKKRSNAVGVLIPDLLNAVFPPIIMGIQEIVEIFQDEILVHAYRQRDDVWTFESIAGDEAEMALTGVSLSVPLAAPYERVLPEEGE